MGFGRKVGAFLGLVPEDGQPYDDALGVDRDRDVHPRDIDSSYFGRSRPLDERAATRPVGSGYSPEGMVHGALAVKTDPSFAREAVEQPAPRPAAVKLAGFAEARVIGEKYRDGQSVIIDLTDMSDADARRLVDFSAGLAFSLHGSIEKVAPKVFMLLPAETDDQAGASEHLLRDARIYATR